MTAKAIQEAQITPNPPIQPSTLLREQNYGSGEGKRWDSPRSPGLTLEEHFEKGIYPALHKRSERFPGGESLDDLAERAEKAIDEFLMPHIRDEGEAAANIAIVSHGIFLSELIVALVKRGDDYKMMGKGIRAGDLRGMKNTGWTKVIVKSASEDSQAETSESTSFHVQVTQVNNCDHILSLKRQRGGIGSSAYDPQQQGIRAFFKERTERRRVHKDLVEDARSR